MAETDPSMKKLLGSAFKKFCSFGNRTGVSVDMDGRTFAKLALESNILSSVVTKTDIDLIFARVKPVRGRKITFGEFLNALTLIAEKEGCDVVDVQSKVIAAEPAVNGATKAEAVRFHDDKSTYTGSQAHSQAEPVGVVTPASLMRRAGSSRRVLGAKASLSTTTRRSTDAKPTRRSSGRLSSNSGSPTRVSELEAQLEEAKDEIERLRQRVEELEGLAGAE